jgi:hypothetical protein
LVDLLGVEGYVEPVSMYLPGPTTWLILSLAFGVLIILLFASSLAFQKWRQKEAPSK